MRRIPRPVPMGFLPLLRDGELLFNAMALQRRIVDGMPIDQAIVDVRGSLSRQRNVMGTDPAIVARRVFGLHQSDPTILLRHTLSGVFCRAMSPDAERAWLQRFDHKRYRHGMCAGLGLFAWKDGAICSNHLRSCKRCVDADLEKRGFATWKVLHQVPSVGRCPTHGVVLENELASRYRAKGEAPLWPLRLPTGVVSAHRDVALPMSEGYAMHLKLWGELFLGELPTLRSDQWRALILAQTQGAAGRASLRRVFEDHIERSWEVPLAVLARHLSLDGGASFVDEELRLRTKPKDVARRLVVYSAGVALGLFSADREQLDLNLAGRRPRDRTRGDTSAERALRAAIAARGLSLMVEDALLAGGTLAATVRLGASRNALARLRRQLPTSLLEALLRCERFGKNSWVACEWHRRKGRADQ